MLCGEGGRDRRRKRPQSIQLLILFHTAKFSIQHVSLVRERERREARARE